MKKIIIITRASEEEYGSNHPFLSKEEENVKKKKELIGDNFRSFISGENNVEPAFLEYKEIIYDDKTVYVLPCYNETLIYNAENEGVREKLLELIIDEFSLQKDEQNEIYIHDTEWGSNTYDYDALIEDKDEIKSEKIKEYLTGIYVFSHSPLSEYFCEILKDNDLKFEKIHEINVKRNVLRYLENPKIKTINQDDLNNLKLHRDNVVTLFKSYKSNPNATLSDIAKVTKAIVEVKK